jgi:hypothetical protein
MSILVLQVKLTADKSKRSAGLTGAPGTGPLLLLANVANDLGKCFCLIRSVDPLFFCIYTSPFRANGTSILHLMHRYEDVLLRF